MKSLLLSTLFFLGALVGSKAQLVINNAVFTIQSGATVTVQGDVTSNVSIQGAGTLNLQGSILQNIDMSGDTIPNLVLNNTANATLLNTNCVIGNSLLLTSGKLQTGNLNLILNPSAAITGNNASNFIQTNGAGQLVKRLAADISNFELPVGENANYRPAYLTTTGSAYSSGAFGVRVIGTADPLLPPMTASYLTTSWPVTKNGITGGTVTLAGQYLDPTDVTGTEANLRGYYNNTTDWSSVSETHNVATNQVSAPITSATGSLSGFNKVLLVGARAFLQGAYDLTGATGLMSDNLRTLPFGSSASTANFPSSDPYRVGPYNTSFTHVNNAKIEAITSPTVVTAQVNTNNNIVDWVYLELLDPTLAAGSRIIQTRSALIQKDGDIVDVDGVSPVTFNNVANGNYILNVRHRNHLGLGLALANTKSLNETNSTAFTTNVIDFRTTASSGLYGTTANYTTAAHPTLGTVNLLWGGNANGDTKTRFSSLNNDRDYILITTLSNLPANVISNTYSAADINMNKIVRFSSINNDRDFLLITILGNLPATVRTQSLPN